jgi:anti-sigma regulatory factor (Ser/Thr protein kinase)
MNERMLTMTFAANFKNVDMARAALQGISSECFGKETEGAADITMAANEAMNNAVEHSGSTMVTVEVARNDNELRVFVVSGGTPFDPVAASADIHQEEMLERDEGGYGLYLIRELVDKFDYEYRDARNVWKLFKFIKS